MMYCHLSLRAHHCHSERSEESRPGCEGRTQSEIPRFARNDTVGFMQRKGMPRQETPNGNKHLH